MTIDTILLIAGAVGIMLLMFVMHRSGHDGHAASRGGPSEAEAFPVDGLGQAGGEASIPRPDISEQSHRGGHGRARATDEPKQKRHGCC